MLTRAEGKGLVKIALSHLPIRMAAQPLAPQARVGIGRHSSFNLEVRPLL